MKAKNVQIEVREVSVAISIEESGVEFISITDIARFKNASEPKDVVGNWMRNRSTIEFLGLWEKLNNPDFKGVEFDAFLFEAGSNSFTLSPTKWIEKTTLSQTYSKVLKISDRLGCCN